MSVKSEVQVAYRDLQSEHRAFSVVS